MHTENTPAQGTHNGGAMRPCETLEKNLSEAVSPASPTSCNNTEECNVTTRGDDTATVNDVTTETALESTRPKSLSRTPGGGAANQPTSPDITTMKKTTSPLEDNNDGRHASDGGASLQLGYQKNDVAELTATSVEGNRVDENQPSSAENNNQNTENVTPKKQDIFDDLAALGRPLDEIIASEKILTALPVQKPKGEMWVRLHPSIQTRVYVYEAKDERSWYIVLPSMVEPMRDFVRYVQMSLAVTYAGVPFVWPVPIPTESKSYQSYVTALHAAELAQKEWIRIFWKGNDYEVYRRPSAKVEPVWPTEITNASEMLRFAAKAGGFEVIDSMDHPVVRGLLGID